MLRTINSILFCQLLFLFSLGLIENSWLSSRPTRKRTHITELLVHNRCLWRELVSLAINWFWHFLRLHHICLYLFIPLYISFHFEVLWIAPFKLCLFLFLNLIFFLLLVCLFLVILIIFLVKVILFLEWFDLLFQFPNSQFIYIILF